jgi:hypothetical protein
LIPLRRMSMGGKWEVGAWSPEVGLRPEVGGRRKAW